jgi:hypothetical protein
MQVRTRGNCGVVHDRAVGYNAYLRRCGCHNEEFQRETWLSIGSQGS